MTTLLRWHSAGMGDVPGDGTWQEPALAARLAAMRYTKRRDEAALGRWTAKQALARALGIDPADSAALRRIGVRNAADGAPEAYFDDRPAGLRIAMTDRADWAVCTVLEGEADVGCDLELDEPRSDAFVRDYFTPHEQAIVAASSAPHRAANLIWSAKESALKVLRTGLRRDTRSVRVELDVDAAGADGAWQPLQVLDLAGGRSFPGHWTKHGSFLLTVASRIPTAPPRSYDEPPPLAGAAPSHAWMHRPLDGSGGLPTGDL